MTNGVSTRTGSADDTVGRSLKDLRDSDVVDEAREGAAHRVRVEPQ